MLRVVGEPRLIERAIKRLQGALKGVPSRGVRLTWRGGELRTTIHWARDDAFWWAVEPRGATARAGARHALHMIRTEIGSVMCQLGAPDVQTLGADFLMWNDASGLQRNSRP